MRWHGCPWRQSTRSPPLCQPRCRRQTDSRNRPERLRSNHRDHVRRAIGRKSRRRECARSISHSQPTAADIPSDIAASEAPSGSERRGAAVVRQQVGADHRTSERHRYGRRKQAFPHHVRPSPDVRRQYAMSVGGSPMAGQSQPFWIHSAARGFAYGSHRRTTFPPGGRGEQYGPWLSLSGGTART
jgi:hypothetical protein